jgi:hypothetical protein
MRDMTRSDRMRLKAHAASHKLFKRLLSPIPGTDESDGLAPLVADLSKAQWRDLRTLVELGFVDVSDARVIVCFTISSLARMGYLG